MSTHYCQPRYISLPDLASYGFAVAGTVTTLDSEQHTLSLHIHRLWGIPSPTYIAESKLTLTLDHASTFQIEKIPWHGMGSSPIQMFHYSKNIADIKTGQDIILVPHRSYWLDLEEQKNITALTQPYPLSFEIMQATDTQLLKLDLFFDADAMHTWQTTANVTELSALLDDGDLQTLAFTILRSRKLITVKFLAKLEEPILRYCRGKIEETFSADEMTALMQDAGEYLKTKKNKAFIDRFHDWIHDALLHQRISLQQSLLFSQQLDTTNDAQRRLLGLYINHLLWLFEKELLGQEFLDSTDAQNLIVHYLTSYAQYESFESNSFNRYFEKLTRERQRDILLALAERLNDSRRAREYGNGVDLDLMFFVLEHTAAQPFVEILPAIQKLDISKIVHTQTRIEARMALMGLAMKFTESFPQLKQKMLNVVNPWLQDESIFHPDMIVSMAEPEKPQQKRQRWDDTLAKYKILLAD